ncbi:MAG: uL15 family ribosomal protein [Patescibacteria group bacterium]
MQLHNIQRNIRNKRSRIIGRGGKHAKTSGRGTKGQKARAGGKLRPVMRDIIKKIPKLRGYRFHAFREQPVAVNLFLLEKVCVAGDIVTPAMLVRKGVVEMRKGKNPLIKILSQGEITKKITISGCSLSKTARFKIEKAGGKVWGVK